MRSKVFAVCAVVVIIVSGCELPSPHTTASTPSNFIALDYSLRRWPAIPRYADSCTLPIDNNPIENAIRPIALGRKNWLFAGSRRAGIRATAIQSLLATAKLNGLDPSAWLKETLDKLPIWPYNRIDEFLLLKLLSTPTA